MVNRDGFVLKSTTCNFVLAGELVVNMYAWWKVGFGLGFHTALREAKGLAHLVEGTRRRPAGFCCRGSSSLMKGPMKI